MKIRSIKLPRHLDKSLYDRAQTDGVSGSSVVREALAEYLGGPPKGRRPEPLSVAALAIDLAGCATGPADLSTNPAGLDGYGRSRTTRTRAK